MWCHSKLLREVRRMKTNFSSILVYVCLFSLNEICKNMTTMLKKSYSAVFNGNAFLHLLQFRGILKNPNWLVSNTCKSKIKSHPSYSKNKNQNKRFFSSDSCVLLGKFKHQFRHFTGSLTQSKVKL